MSKNASATSDDNARQLYLEYKALSEQAKRVQDYLEQTEQNLADLDGVRDALEEYGKLPAGSHVFSPIANGIFIDATIRDAGVLHMNIGSGVVVPKTVPEAHAVLATQRATVEKLRDRAHKDYADLVQHLQRIEQQVGGA